MERRPTFAVIDTGALRHNYLELRRLASGAAKFMAVVKANAYGHGDVEAARVFEGLGCEYFGVALVEEGERLRRGGIKAPVVVLGGIFPNQMKAVFDHDLTPVVFDLNTASLLNEYAVKYGTVKKAHVKIDTGMGRLGLQPDEADSFFEEMRGFKNLAVEGVLSHFSSVDSVDRGFSLRQLGLFEKTVARVKALGFSPELIHMGNSAALVDMKEAHFNLIRPGIMLYGSYPAERFRDKVNLKPVMRLTTRILHVKGVGKGFPVGYGGTFVTKRASVIATLPIGYGDGLPRSLTNKGTVLVNGKRAPIAGTVCMDLTMCDVTDVPNVRAGDEAVLIGAQGSETITVEEVASKAGTISYEILCAIGPRVGRVYA